MKRLSTSKAETVVPVREYENQLADELQHQLNTVNELRRTVAALEWETLVLQSDLLARETELASTTQELSQLKDNAPVVYNITNMPLGGSVIAVPSGDIQGFSESANEAVTQDSSGASVSESNGQPVEIRQQAFFGPAPDRYEDLIQPGFAEPLHQE